MTTPDVRVFLLDDHAMLRAGLRSLVGDLPGFTVVGEDGDVRAALPHIAEARPDVVLLDIAMPGLSGLDAIAPLRDVLPKVRVLMLSHHEGGTFVEQALQRGADGYLSKDSEPDELALAMRSVLRGQTYISPRVTAGLVPGGLRGAEPAGLSSLTPREREVFQLLALGRSNKEVARELDMSLGTAKKHRENLQRKLDCHSAAELARLAIREGLLEG